MFDPVTGPIVFALLVAWYLLGRGRHDLFTLLQWLGTGVLVATTWAADRVGAERVGDKTAAGAERLRERRRARLAPSEPRTRTGQVLRERLGEAKSVAGRVWRWMRLTWADATAAARSSRERYHATADDSGSTRGRRGGGSGDEPPRGDGPSCEDEPADDDPDHGPAEDEGADPDDKPSSGGGRRGGTWGGGGARTCGGYRPWWWPQEIWFWTLPDWLRWPTGSDPEAPVQARAERLDRPGPPELSPASDDPPPPPPAPDVVDAEVVDPPTVEFAPVAPPALPPIAPLAITDGRSTTMTKQAAEAGLSGYLDHSAVMVDQIATALASTVGTLNAMTRPEEGWSGVPVAGYKTAVEHLEVVHQAFVDAHQAFFAAWKVREAYAAEQQAGEKGSVNN